MILKFKGPTARAEFLTMVKDERKDIFASLRPARRLPDVIATGLDKEQVDWVNRHIQDLGKAYADVQFRVFGS